MLNPPEAPSTYQTLQIACVACQAPFTIAEGTPGATPDQARPAGDGPADARRGDKDWQMPAEERPYIRYQFRQNTAERVTNPPGRPETTRAEAKRAALVLDRGEAGQTAVDPPEPEPRPYVSLACPRCGADNRNWVALMQPSRHQTDLLSRLEHQWQRFPLSIVALLVTVVMMALSFVFALGWIDQPWRQWMPLVLSIFACGGGISLGVTSIWRQMLERERLQQHLAFLAPRGLAPTIQMGLFVTGLAALLVPLLLYSLLPAGVSFVVPSYKRPPFPLTFFLAWVGFIVFTGGQATVLASMAVSRYVHRINRHIPPPLYHSIANMTRVVVWEVKHALEVDGQNMNHVQWLSVRRNEVGGIDLVGLQRAPAGRSQPGLLDPALIRAQQYRVQSDRWGYLREARIRDVQVPPSGFGAGSAPQPQRAAEEEAFMGAMFRPPADVRLGRE